MNPAQKIFGLIGYPVKHSLSSLMHNAAFKALGISAEYKLFEVKPEELGNFFNRLDQQNIYGFNVTIPHKEKVLEFIELDSESFYLREIKAVNTIVKKDNSWKGFNTDIPGFQKHLQGEINPFDKRAAVLGAGGAARAVAYVLSSLKAKEIAIFDVDASKAQGVITMVKNLFPNFKIYATDKIEKLDLKEKDLLVNATPVGMKENDPCLITQEMLHRDLFVYDLIYNPARTKLLALAEKVGARNSNGLGMLLYQGVLSFRHFTGLEAPLGSMRKALMEGVEKL
jgi:shikimate dehydrogenase